jgi:hypothetical protein
MSTVYRLSDSSYKCCDVVATCDKQVQEWTCYERCHRETISSPRRKHIKPENCLPFDVDTQKIFLRMTSSTFAGTHNARQNLSSVARGGVWLVRTLIPRGPKLKKGVQNAPPNLGLFGVRCPRCRILSFG